MIQRNFGLTFLVEHKIDIAVTVNGIDLFYKVHYAGKQAANNYFEDKITKEEAKELYKILGKIKS